MSDPVMSLSTFRSEIFSTSFARGQAVVLLQSYARSRIFGILSEGIHKGHLLVEDEEGSHNFGTAKAEQLPVVLKVHNANIWGRILLSHDIGLSEAYMQGDFEVSSLKKLLDLWLDNRAGLAALANSFSSAVAYYSALAINALGRQSLTLSKRSVQAAYDVSNDFFQCFLSKEMMYSCAVWGEEENGVRGDLTVGPSPGDLESAQKRKLHHILKKARVRPGDRLLEIGTGWGAMAIEAARLGCTVDSVTLSIEQKQMAEQRAAEAGLSDKVNVHLCDYRKLPRSFEDSFDAVVTCEMIEAVGKRHLAEFFSILNWALKKDRATIVITATAQPEHRYTDYQFDDFARHYHWPNCHLPSATSLAIAVQDAVPGKFVLESIEDHGIHYPRTLREWGRRLQKNFKGEVVAQLQERYPELRDEQNLLAFKRKWEYMFVYAEVGYARAYTSLNCWTFVRPENVLTECA